jgi:hypothetical protein
MSKIKSKDAYSVYIPPSWGTLGTALSFYNKVEPMSFLVGFYTAHGLHERPMKTSRLRRFTGVFLVDQRFLGNAPVYESCSNLVVVKKHPEIEPKFVAENRHIAKF